MSTSSTHSGARTERIVVPDNRDDSPPDDFWDESADITAEDVDDFEDDEDEDGEKALERSHSKIVLFALSIIALTSVAGLVLFPAYRQAIVGAAILLSLMVLFVMSRLGDGMKPEWLPASKPEKFGPRRLLWHGYVVFKMWRYPLVPLPRPFAFYGVKRDENRDWVYSVRHAIRAIVVFFDGKGGIGKTTGSTWLAAEERIATEQPVGLLDADSGGGDDALDRFELDASQALSTDDCANMIINHGWIPTYEDIGRLMQFHDATGVGVTTMQNDSNIDRDTMSALLLGILPAVNAIYVDATPGYKEPNTYGAIRVATVTVLPGLYHVKASIKRIRMTLDHKGYGLREKIAEGKGVIIEISAVPWRKFNVRTQYELAERFGVDPKFVVLLPYNRWLKNTQPVAYDRDKREYTWRVPIKYRWALSQVLRLRAEIALEHNKAHPPASVPGAPHRRYWDDQNQAIVSEILLKPSDTDNEYAAASQDAVDSGHPGRTGTSPDFTERSEP